MLYEGFYEIPFHEIPNKLFIGNIFLKLNIKAEFGICILSRGVQRFHTECYSAS